MKCMELLKSQMDREELIQKMVSLAHYFNLSDDQIVQISNTYVDNENNLLTVDSDIILSIDTQLTKVDSCQSLCEQYQMCDTCSICKSGVTKTNTPKADENTFMDIEKLALSYILANNNDKKIQNSLKAKTEQIFISMYELNGNDKTLIPLNREFASFIYVFPSISEYNFDSAMQSFFFSHEEYDTPEIRQYLQLIFQDSKQEFSLQTKKTILSFLSKPEEYRNKISNGTKKKASGKSERLVQNTDEENKETVSPFISQLEEEETESVISFSSMYNAKKEELENNCEQDGNQTNEKSDTCETVLEDTQQEELGDYDKKDDEERAENSTNKEDDQQNQKPKRTFSILDENLYLHNHIMINEYSYIQTVCDSNDAVVLDKDLIKNKHLSIEYVVDKDQGEGLLLYLNESKLFYFVSLMNDSALLVMKYYLENRQSINKITYFYGPVNFYCLRYGIKVANLSSINCLAIYEKEFENNENGLIEMNEKYIQKKYPYDRPYILFIMRYYVSLMSGLEVALPKEQISKMKKIKKINQYISNSYMISDITQCKKIYVCYEEGYIPRLNYDENIIADGSRIKLQIINKDGDSKINKKIFYDSIWNLIICGAIERFNPRILQLSEKDGMIFLLQSDGYRNFITVLHRVLLDLYKTYDTNKPVLQVITKLI